jgi:hypothetical protein
MLSTRNHILSPTSSINFYADKLHSRDAEYAILEKKYTRLRRLAEDMDNIIEGMDEEGEPHERKSIAELRALAGREGLAAKTSRGIRDGSKQRTVAEELQGAALSLAHKVGGVKGLKRLEALMDQAGGMESLKTLVSETPSMRAFLTKAGGMVNLSSKVTLVDNMGGFTRAHHLDVISVR